MWAARRSSTSRCGQPSRRAVRSRTSATSSTPARRRSSSRPSRPTRERLPRIPDAQLLRAFAAIAQAGGLAGVHAEGDEIVRAGIAAEQAAGHGADPLAHARSRPPVAEHEAIARCLELARATGVRLHVCHVSTPRGVELVTQARRDGVDVSAETCPHYLLLDESALIRSGGEAKIYNPPLREATPPAHGLDLISSDHVGWPPERKHGPSTSSRWPPAPPASS